MDSSASLGWALMCLGTFAETPVPTQLWSLCLILQQASLGLFSGQHQGNKRQKVRTLKCFFKHMFMLHLLTSYRPQRVSWLNPESRVATQSPTQNGKMLQRSIRRRSREERGFGAIFAINLPQVGEGTLPKLVSSQTI